MPDCILKLLDECEKQNMKHELYIVFLKTAVQNKTNMWLSNTYNDKLVSPSSDAKRKLLVHLSISREIPTTTQERWKIFFTDVSYVSRNLATKKLKYWNILCDEQEVCTYFIFYYNLCFVFKRFNIIYG